MQGELRITRHELNDMVFDFGENEFDVLRVAVFKLLLQKSTPMLILAQTIDLSLQTLKRCVGETRI